MQMAGCPAVPHNIIMSPYGELLSAVGVFTIPFLREHGVFVPA